MPENQTLEQGDIERSLTKDERENIDTSDFAWPEEKKYPIDTQDHLDAAAKLIGHAPENKQAEIKANIIRIAKKHGFTLPDSWQEESKDNKDSSDRAVAQEVAQVAMPDHALFYAPITRIDQDKWEVEGVATSEAPDSFNTIFSYDASKRAFEQWASKYSNVREMHDRKAVAKGIQYRFDDANKQIMVRSKVSRGAPDTWQKVLDDILCGYSIGATKCKWDTVERNGKTYPYCTDYELVELSLVDRPSNADCNIAVARVDGLTDVVDVTEPEPAQPAQEQPTPEPQTGVGYVGMDGEWHKGGPPVERAGARLSADTQSGMHSARDNGLLNAMALMNLCGCDECQGMIAAIDPDGDGDIDLPGADSTLDPDQDADALAERIVASVTEKILSRLDIPVMRMQTIAGQFARIQTPDIDLSPIQRSIEALETRFADVPTQSSFDEVRSALAEVKGQVEKIAAQPMPGGPMLNAAAVDKRFATQSYLPQASTEEEEEQRVLARLAASGKLTNHELQTAAAARVLRRM